MVGPQISRSAAAAAARAAQAAAPTDQQNGIVSMEHATAVRLQQWINQELKALHITDESGKQMRIETDGILTGRNSVHMSESATGKALQAILESKGMGAFGAHGLEPQEMGVWKQHGADAPLVSGLQQLTQAGSVNGVYSADTAQNLNAYLDTHLKATNAHVASHEKVLHDPMGHGRKGDIYASSLDPLPNKTDHAQVALKAGKVPQQVSLQVPAGPQASNMGHLSVRDEASRIGQAMGTVVRFSGNEPTVQIGVPLGADPYKYREKFAQVVSEAGGSGAIHGVVIQNGGKQPTFEVPAALGANDKVIAALANHKAEFENMNKPAPTPQGMAKTGNPVIDRLQNALGTTVSLDKDHNFLVHLPETVRVIAGNNQSGLNYMSHFTAIFNKSLGIQRLGSGDSAKIGSYDSNTQAFAVGKDLINKPGALEKLEASKAAFEGLKDEKVKVHPNVHRRYGESLHS
jgi:hypothetical protein